jgi:hypothetical protein
MCDDPVGYQNQLGFQSPSEESHDPAINIPIWRVGDITADLPHS